MTFTLDEAIKHLEDELRNPKHIWECDDCRFEHEQLLRWLKVLKTLKECPFVLENFFKNKGLKNQEAFDKKYFWGTITDDKVEIVKRFLEYGN